MARLARPLDPFAHPPDSRTPDGRTPQFTQKERDFAYAVAMKYVRNDDEAADVAQDAMLTAYRNRHAFRGQSRFTTWLYRVAATTALMHLRKKRRAPVELTVSVDEDAPRALEVADPTSSPEELAAAHEAVERVQRRLDELGERYGEVFARRFAGGESEVEIASSLDLCVATVKTRAYRARLALREVLRCG